MKILEILKNKKLFFFQIFLTLYIAINLVGGDRGLVSYFEKKNYEEKLSSKHLQLSKEIEEIEHKNKLLADKILLSLISFGRASIPIPFFSPGLGISNKES